MNFEEDERAQSVLVGAILLFAILIIAFSSYQAFVVPNQNAEVEFTHSQQIENEFSDFRSNVVNAIESTDERSTSFTLGTQYPARLLALNPPAPAGTLSTTEARPIELDGADLVDVCGTDDATTRSLVYEPGYNEHRSAQSTVYEHAFVGTTFRDGESVSQPQRVIQDDRVDLQLITGDISESRTGSFGIDINATHRYTHDEEITALTIPSRFDNETWENQILSDQENIESVEDVGEERIEITLDEPLTVSCAVVGLNSEPAFTPPPTDPEPEDPGEVVEAESLFDTRWIERNGVDIEDPRVEAKPGETDVNLTMRAVERETEVRIQDATVDFAIEGSLDIFDQTEPQGDTNDGNGEQFFELDINDEAPLGEQSQVYTTAGDDSDVVTVEVIGFAVDIINTNSPVEEGETVEVTAEIENTGSQEDTQNIELLDFGGTVVDSESVTIPGEDSTTVELEWATEAGDAGTGDITVRSEDDEDTEGVTIDTSDEEPPEFTTIEITSSGPGNNNNQLTFAYETTADATGVTLFAESTAGTQLVNDPNAPLNTAGETYTFGNVNMNNQDINIEMTVEDTDGNSRSCSGSITTQAGTLTDAGMTCETD